MTDTTEVEASAALALAGIAPEFNRHTTGNYAVLPDGYKLHSLEAYQQYANRTETTITFIETGSLAAYLTRFGWPSTLLLTVDYTQFLISGVLDYSVADADYHHKHIARFGARKSSKFAVWEKMCGKALTQTDLALFLESRAVDVFTPDAADIMEMVLKFEATKTVEFKSSTRLQDGSRQFVYVEDAQQRGQMTLPGFITILVPVFEGMEPQMVKIWLRFRIEDAKLRLILEIHDKDEMLREAFGRCVDAFRHDIPPAYTQGLLTVG